ncbi:MAG: hypothetical protein JXA66_02540 [Oligoflexia bacterium]|nr:hypothetical protein [Oligoflexia bacterium]
MVLLLHLHVAGADKLDLVFGDSFLKKADCEMSAAHYEKYLDEKADPVVASNYAVSLYCLGKTDRAVKYLENTLKNIKPGTVPGETLNTIRYNLGILLAQNIYRQKDADGVLSGVNPDILPVRQRSLYWAAVCRLDFNREMFSEAVKKCGLAFSLSDQTCYVNYWYGMALNASGVYPDALVHLEVSYSRCPDDDVSYYYALTLYRMGDKQTASDVLSGYRSSARNDELYKMIKREL